MKEHYSAVSLLTVTNFRRLELIRHCEMSRLSEPLHPARVLESARTRVSLTAPSHAIFAPFDVRSIDKIEIEPEVYAPVVSGI
jgi:hypothetical protein